MRFSVCEREAKLVLYLADFYHFDGDRLDTIKSNVPSALNNQTQLFINYLDLAVACPDYEAVCE